MKKQNRNFLREAEERQRAVDQLIDAYDSGQHRKGPAVIDVDCFPGEIKFASLGPDGQLWYRGRILRCIKRRTASAARHRDLNQSDIETICGKGAK